MGAQLSVQTGLREATRTLADLAKPGAPIPESRYDQLVEKSGVLSSKVEKQQLFDVSLQGLGYLNPEIRLALMKEAERLARLNYVSLETALESLQPDSEIVVAYNSLCGAISDRYDRMYDVFLADSRRFGYLAVATAGEVLLDLRDAS